jgi:hypothetical protein
MRFFFNKHSKSQNGSDSNGHATATEDVVQVPVDTQDEIAAVIALAVNMYVTEMREYENTILTMQQVIKPYSPWNSKIYGLRQQPIRIPGLRSRIK